MTGGAEFNELFLDQVRIPDANVVGGVGNGWKVALTTLMNERSGLAFFNQGLLRRRLDRLVGELAARGRLADARIRDQLADLHARVELLRLTAFRGLAAIEKYGQPGPEGSLTKLMWSQTNQRIVQLAADTLGAAGARVGHLLGLRAAPRAREHDRGRDDRDPQEHRRRARPRTPQGAGSRMHFDLTDEQREIRDTARALLEQRSSPARVREAAESGRHDDALWREMNELGWAGISIDRRGRRPGARARRAVHPRRGARRGARADAVPGERLRRADDPPRRHGRPARAVAPRARVGCGRVARSAGWTAATSRSSSTPPAPT